MSWYFTHAFPVTALLVKLPNTSIRVIHVMDHRRLLPGGPSSPEGSTVASKVLSFRFKLLQVAFPYYHTSTCTPSKLP